MLPLIIAGGIAIGALLAAGVTCLAFLTYKIVKDWFNAKRSLTDSDEKYVETTIKTRLDNGSYGIVQGIFDEKTGEFVAGQCFEAKNLDSELDAKHNGHTVVLYNR